MKYEAIVSGTSPQLHNLSKIFKTIRKLNGGAISITQDVSDMLSLEMVIMVKL